MAAPGQRSVAPETFLLDQEQQSSLPADSVVALQQVDNRECRSCRINGSCMAATRTMLTIAITVKYFLISAPVDWSPDQYIRRFLLPTGEYVSCVLWCVLDV